MHPIDLLDGWSTAPAADQLPLSMEILRVPAKGLAGAICLSSDLIGRPLHYWSGRTRVCTGASCIPCQTNHRPRWTGYLQIWSPRSRRQWMLEVTAASAPAIAAWKEIHKTLRGAQLDAYRSRNKLNGRLTIDLAKATHADSEMPAERDLRPLLLKLWGVIEMAAENVPPSPELQNRIHHAKRTSKRNGEKIPHPD